MRWLKELTNLHLLCNTFGRILCQILEVSHWSADEQDGIELRLTP